MIWRNDLLIHTMMFNGFILRDAFVNPADISMGIKLRAECFPILGVIRLNWYRRIVECGAIIITTCDSQYRRTAWNPLFSTMAQLDHGDRRFNLDPTTPNCIYLGTLN
jgi:PAS domain-containing protein